MTVRDEAVEAACVAMYAPDLWEQMLESARQTKRGWMRYALEAAEPHLAPRPVIDREVVVNVIREREFFSGHPMADRKALVDELVALARPMPTREQIAKALYAHWQRDDAYPCEWANCDTSIQAEWLEKADAVLALINGSES